MEELKRIMLVEDDRDIQEIIKLSLSSVGGFEVEGFLSGIDALNHFPQTKPQLILLDVMMPVMDGPTVLKRLQSKPETVNIPVVFITAKVQPSEVASYKKMGVIDVISKPFDPMKLPEIIKQIWMRLNQKNHE